MRHNSTTMANRTVIFFKNYFQEFFSTQTPQVKKKIAQTLVWVQEVDQMPVSIFKSIEGVRGLFEIRIECSGNIFRIFCCFDKGNLVVLFNAFQKKTQKTPKKEIDKAERLMVEYFNTKKDDEN